MEIRVLDAIVELLQFLQAIKGTCGWPWRFGEISKSPKPGRLLVAATPAVVVDRYRRQHDRHCRRCRCSARESDWTQIRTHDIKILRDEKNARTGRKFRRTHCDHRSTRTIEICERGSI